MIPTQHLAVFTIALPIVMAVLMIFLKKHSNTQNILNVLGSVAVLILSILLVKTVLTDGIQVYEVGEWGKYGIMLVADLLSA
ncbi:MAG: cation:proton antiporter, partial [Methanosarcinales archaeon]|nr:cation:proton antiporter [Methanosarcinales archaeon]